MITVLLHGPPSPSAGSWGWAQTVALIVPVIALAGAVLGAVITYRLNQRAARRERRAKVFAEALTAIEDYAEMPYRILRRSLNADTRTQLTNEISTVKSRIAFHHAWLRIEAPDVVTAYATLDCVARAQAGQQMSEAWQQPPLTTDEQMNIGAALPRDKIDAARDRCVKAMKKSLHNSKKE